MALATAEQPAGQPTVPRQAHRAGRVSPMAALAHEGRGGRPGIQGAMVERGRGGGEGRAETARRGPVTARPTASRGVISALRTAKVAAVAAVAAATKEHAGHCDQLRGRTAESHGAHDVPILRDPAPQCTKSHRGS